MSNEAQTPVPLGEIEHGPSKLEQFMEKNLKKVLLLALLLIIAIAAYIVMRQLNDDKQRQAGEALIAAQDGDAYRKVSQEFAGTPAATTAKLLLADQLWKEGRQNDAIEALRSLIKDNEGHPAANNARFALATSLLSQGKADEAKSLFEGLVNDSSAKAFHAHSLIALGDLAKAAGQNEEAKAYYNRKIENYEVYEDQNIASKRLSLVGVQNPEKVAPPEPPAPTAPEPTSPEPASPEPAIEATPAEPVGQANVEISPTNETSSEPELEPAEGSETNTEVDNASERDNGTE